MDIQFCITLGQILVSAIIICMLGMAGLTTWFLLAHDVTAKKKCKRKKVCGNADCERCKE